MCEMIEKNSICKYCLDKKNQLYLQRNSFLIPKLHRERNLYGSDFEVKLRNKLEQKAIAKECADWIRRKVRFKSNASQEVMGGMSPPSPTTWTAATAKTTPLWARSRKSACGIWMWCDGPPTCITTSTS